MNTRNRARAPRGLRAALLCAAVLFLPVRALAADAVERWNQAMTDWAATANPPPFIEARAYAMAHIAVLDAARTALLPSNAGSTSLDAAVAAAAHDVAKVELGKFGDVSSLDAFYAAELAGVPNGPAKARGLAIGQAAAAAMLASRADEDVYAAIGAPFTPGTAPGEYRATTQLPGLVVGAGWGSIRTFAVKSGEQFRAPPPYSLASLQYAADVNEVRVFGAAGAAARTQDQTAIAYYWYENSPFAWNRIARAIAAPLSPLEHARLYAALNAALSDAYVTSLESKFHYRFWRPITAIQEAASDGNPLTDGDPAWLPAFITPPIPDYPSGHSAAGGAAAEVITAFLGNRSFDHTSTTGALAYGPGGLPPSYERAVTRHFANALEAARENAYSRVLVGIHFRLACTVGLHQGREIGRYVVERAQFLKPAAR